MTREISRRTFTGLAASLPLILAGSQLVGATTLDASIGAKQAAFDAMFGTPRTEGWFTVYDFRDEGKAAYWVAWDANGFAHRIAIDFSAIAGGGLTFSPGLLGQSQFLPSDASINAAGDLTNLQIGQTGYYIAQHHSGDVQQRTGRSGNILVVDERAIPGDGPNNPNFIRTSVAMEAWEVNPIVGTGALPSPFSRYEEMGATFGSMSGNQRGSWLDSPPVPGRWMFYDGTIDIVLDEPIPAIDAASWISDFVPADAGEQSTTYWLPGPGDTEGLRVSFWPYQHQNLVALQVVHNGEESGRVSRMILGLIAPATI